MTGTTVGDLRQAATRDDRVLIVLAGPNGAGKSTFFEAYLADTGVRFVNADLIARSLNPSDPASTAYTAAQLAEEERRRLIDEGTSFCMETVFSDPAGVKLNFLRYAQAAGYTVFLVFIGLLNVDLSIGRVIQRVEDGGHDVPDDKLRQRFPRTRENLRQAVQFIDHVWVFDNSSCDEPYRFIALFEGGRLIRRAAVLPAWFADSVEIASTA